ncbi:hypothetical protein N665_3725s0006 [Sinapis alba]|nr:hypothetical protein N665_3725s0006 [Sinapis alba]
MSKRTTCNDNDVVIVSDTKTCSYRSHIEEQRKSPTDKEEGGGEGRIQMAARSSLIRLAFVCIVLAVVVMTAESHGGHHHGPTKAPAMAPVPHPHTPAPSAATFSAYPQLIATVFVGALSFVF